MKGKRILLLLGIIVLIIFIAVAGYLIYVVYGLPNVKVKEISVESTSARIERGAYLANHVTVCMDCHSTRDWGIFSGPIVPGTEGRGGELFDQKMGFPGAFYSPNITPFSLGGWSDGEIYRAITAGVSKDGRPLFPVMPYPFYGSMDDEDIFSIIAYLRSLKPIEYTAPASKADFPMSIILHMIPKEGVPGKMPPKGPTAEYGKYLADAASCIECHTPAEKGKIIMEKAYSGGREFPLPGGTLISANITPDPKTGIGTWTVEAFLTRFKTATLENYSLAPVDKNAFNTMMPWTMYSGMDTTDLVAIHAYLMSLKPLENQTQKFIPKNQ